MLEQLKALWAGSSPFRHAAFAFLSVQLAIPLAQVSAWAESRGASPLPNWHSVLVDLGYAIVAAAVAALVRASTKPPVVK